MERQQRVDRSKNGELPIGDDKLLSEFGPDDNLLPVIVNVFSLHDICVVLEIAHVNDTLQVFDQCSSPRDLIPVVETIVNDIEVRPNQENVSMSQAAENRKAFTGEKFFSCDVCSKFPDGRRLKRYYKTHTGEKSHKCEVCVKTT